MLPCIVGTREMPGHMKVVIQKWKKHFNLADSFLLPFSHFHASTRYPYSKLIVGPGFASTQESLKRLCLRG